MPCDLNWRIGVASLLLLKRMRKVAVRREPVFRGLRGAQRGRQKIVQERVW
jgi:hypothetical protein